MLTRLKLSELDVIDFLELFIQFKGKSHKMLCVLLDIKDADNTELEIGEDQAFANLFGLHITEFIRFDFLMRLLASGHIGQYNNSAYLLSMITLPEVFLPHISVSEKEWYEYIRFCKTQ